MNEKLEIIFKNATIGEIKGFIDESGNPWFYASKVCDCLKLENSSVVISRIKEKHLKYGDKIEGVSICYPLIKTAGGRQKVAVVNENILYEMIFMSHTEKAFKFQQWVFKEILPALRKHGEYRIQGKLLRRNLTDTIKTEICEKTENIHRKRNEKVVVQYDKKTGEFIAEYKSIEEAKRQLGIFTKGSGINRCCKGLKKSAYGYKWRYKK